VIENIVAREKRERASLAIKEKKKGNKMREKIE